MSTRNDELSRMGMARVGIDWGKIVTAAVERAQESARAINDYQSGKDRNVWNVAKTFIPLADHPEKDISDTLRVFEVPEKVVSDKDIDDLIKRVRVSGDGQAFAFFDSSDFRLRCPEHSQPLSGCVLYPISDDDPREVIWNPFAHAEIYGADAALVQRAWRRRFQSSAPVPCKILIAPTDL